MQRSAILLAAGMEAGHTDHGYQADRLTISHKLHKLLACAGGGVGGAALASDGQVMERSGCRMCQPILHILDVNLHDIGIPLPSPS